MRIDQFSGWVRRFWILSILALALTACGGGSGGGTGFSVNVPVQDLDGTWFGSLSDTVGVLHVYQVTITGGAISEILIDAIDQGLTGAIVRESDTLFSVTLSDGTEAGFLVDAAVQHAAFIDDGFNVGIVQKDATGLPTFLINDTDGSWSGNSVTTDFTVFQEFVSSATCLNLSCTATGNGVTSSVDLSGTFSSAFGRWTGTFSNTAGISGTATVMLSVDKQFAGSFACDAAGVFPVDCEFSAWVKQ